jgi:isoleucyl-tRNA synthetase
MKRIPDVLDTWFDSGSMPYAQMHYPFENKEKFEKSFPAEFIAEGQDQTRAWFYYLHIIATATKGSHAFQNVIVNGIVLAEDGKKMSKKLQNYPDPNVVLEKYGADALRYYLVTSPVMHAENLNFSEEGVREMYNKLMNTVSNVLSFYEMFANHQLSTINYQLSTHVLDQWIMARLDQLIAEVTERMEAYELAEAARPIVEFVSDLSQWYVRRSRDRFKGDNEEDKQCALATLREVFLTLSKIMAPFTPFIAEKIYQELRSKNKELVESVHLEAWPKAKKNEDEIEILEQMTLVRKVTEMGHSLRKEAGIPVRQPLRALSMSTHLPDDLNRIILDELNIKEVVNSAKGDGWITKEDGDLVVALDTTMTDELKKEGLVREIIRTINQKRKENNFTREDGIAVEYGTDDSLLASAFDEYADEIKAAVLADSLASGGTEAIKIDGRQATLSIKKV